MSLAPADPRPVSTPAIISVKPVVLAAPDRGQDLHVRVSAPITGRDLPVIVLSHGFGSSMDGYAPWSTSGPATGASSSSPPTWTPTLSPSPPTTPALR